MAVTENERGPSLATVILPTLGVIAALYLGREFFIPIALALFLNTLLRPVVRRLVKARLPAPVAAAVVMLGLLAMLSGMAMLLRGPAEAWFNHAPDSIHAAQTRLRKLFKPFQQVSSVAAELGRTAQAPGAPEKPVVVAPASPQTSDGLYGSTATFIVGLAEVLLLLSLLLAGGGMFLERLVSMIPERVDKRTAVHIASEVEGAVSQYLVTTALINLVEGVAVGLSLWALRMPDPALWGALTVGLEFIPYVGGAALVTLLSVAALATFDSVAHAVLIPLAYLAISVLQNSIVSPLFYRNRLKLNPVAVMIAVLFWGYLWGVAGAFLAVPILAAVKILCDDIESLGPVAKFLSS